ncbi:Maf-domain-containing protein [Viridothelium virens]|uniref:Maf-domain-containing protein n=1 Tax=Viridothelium virens TaxID=1048519 RepID=A0A6A6H0S0_VIRVR|nr:Maf-domain-containing protein [Viridothelium virens]
MVDVKYTPAPSEPSPSDPPPSYTTASAQPTPSTISASLPSRGPPIPRPPLPLELPALSMLRGKRVVLASASPRRKQLLAQIGLTQLETIPSPLPEDLPHTLAPFEYVLQTATRKAQAVYAQEINNEAKGEPALVLAADTVVVSASGMILEKPRSEREHVAMLRRGSGGWHKVFTAVAVMRPLESLREPGYAMETIVEETAVKFDQAAVTDDLITAYVKTREGADKAGGYGIQGIGSILIEKIDGSFDNVVGLPLRATLQLIEKVVTHDEEEEDEAAAGVYDDEEDD